jgi:transcriptional regulator with XRE-family HTH domain
MSTGLTEPLDTRWGERVREYRVRRGFTQETFAKEIGVSQAFVSLIENGHRTPPDDLKWKMAQKLGVRPEKLFPWPKAQAS